MKIIRDNDMSISIIPALKKFGVNRCNIKECKNDPTTIILNQKEGEETVPNYAICEDHWNEYNTPRGGVMKLEWN